MSRHLQSVFTGAQSDSDEERSASVTRLGPPGKGKVKASTPLPIGAPERIASNASRVAPGSALSCQTRDVERGVFSGTTDEGMPFAVGGPSSSQKGALSTSTPGTRRITPSTSLRFNKTSSSRERDEGRRLAWVAARSGEPAFPRAARSLRCPQFPDAFLGGSFLGQGCYRLPQGQERLCSPRLVARRPSRVASVPLKNRTCVVSIWIRFHADCPSSKCKASGGRAPHADPPNVEVPLERRVDVLVRPGAGRQEFLERFSSRSRRAIRRSLTSAPAPRPPEPDRRHDVPDAHARRRRGPYFRGCSAHGRLVRQRISQAFLPERRVVVPEDFEVGDRPLDFGGFLAAGEVRQPLHPTDPAVRHRVVRVSFDVPLRERSARSFEQDIREASPTDTPMEGSPAPRCGRFRYLGGRLRSRGRLRWRGAPLAPCGRVRGSLPPIDEESRDMTPPSTSAAFTSVPATPSNSSQTSFASVGSTGTFGGPRFDTASFDTTPTPQASGSALVGFGPHISIPVGNDASHSVVGEKVTSRDFAPAADRHQPQVLPPPSPVRAASVGAADEVSFDEFETSEACCVNGVGGFG
ncbi:hypothetical protein B0H14DRAFT_2554679 [Mycena olivaceomarginata]|nr:hypothetical protein B0H14DRAFT_2554679 [Mycena olivaceomarginata]